jgi:dolichol-phosphate mannosyltransferase
MSVSEQENKDSSRILVVIPTLNEEESIVNVISGIGDSLKNSNYHDFEIVVVDGNSTDRTVDLAKSVGVEVIFQEGTGYGDALLTGFLHARYEKKASVTVMIDGDGTYSPADIPKLLQPLLAGEADLMLGNRFASLKEGSMSSVNKLGNRVFSRIVSSMVKMPIEDSQCGLRAFRSDLVDLWDLKTTGMPFATEMLVETKKMGMKIRQVPVSYYPRKGKTKLNPIVDGFRIMGTIVRLVRDFEPLLFFGVIGLLFAIVGALVGVRVVIEWLETGAIVHLASVMLSALLIMTGFQLFSIGLLADMVKDVRRKVVRRSSVMN